MTQQANKIREFLPPVSTVDLRHSTVLRYAGILIVGILLGWFVLGWWLVPVQYSEVYPNELRSDVRDSYLLMVAEGFAVTGNVQEAAKRLRYWQPEELGPMLFNQAEALRNTDPTGAQYLNDLATALRLTESGQVAGSQTEQAPELGERLSTLGRLLLYVLGAVVILFVALYILSRLRLGDKLRRKRLQPRPQVVTDVEEPYDGTGKEAEFGVIEPTTVPPRPIRTGAPSKEVSDDEERGARMVSPPSFARPDQTESSERPPWQESAGTIDETTVADTEHESQPVMPSFPPAPTSETLDDKTSAIPKQDFQRFTFDGTSQYNQIFSIEERDTYLGEYGMGTGAFARDDSSQILSLEVWLFDKSDIHTVSAALIPPEVYEDELQHQKLVGENIKVVVPLEPGAVIKLATERLEINGRVRRVDFGPMVEGISTVRYAEVELIGFQRQ